MQDKVVKGVRMSLLFRSLPVDRSLQAFKDWMQSYPLKLDAGDKILTRQWIDEEHWIENWKKFWAKVDRDSGSKRSQDK
jgi:hypothetical protein